jgi:lysophospholipase L1-like esterase
MKKIFVLGSLVVGLVSASAQSAVEEADKALVDGRAAAESKFRSLFNGKDLSGWDGNKELWSAKDGTITGQTTAGHPIAGNTFLIWTNGNVGDFELRCSYRIVPDNKVGFGNSGIQYRSHIIDSNNWVVGGYQADFEAGKKYSGILYEERGRGILAERGQKVVIHSDGKKEVVGSLGNTDEIQAAIKDKDWNEYVIVAKGNHLQHFINGKKTIDLVDEQETAAAKSGVLALQIHKGEPMTVQFKNIRIQTNETEAKPTAKPQASTQSTVVPIARHDKTTARYEELNKRVKENQGDLDVLFVGDSITQGWEGSGKDVWKQHYGSMKALNIGIGGDRTEHVLWRLDHGNADGIKPKATVLMIGTNNSGEDRNSAEEIVEGVTAVVHKLQEKFPETKILLLGIFPRGDKFNNQRGKILQVNQAIHRLEDNQKVFFLDFGHVFLNADGSISKEIMPDYLHLSAKGYEMWAQAIEPKLKELAAK